MLLPVLNMCRTHMCPFLGQCQPFKMVNSLRYFHSTRVSHRKSIYKTESKKVRFYVVTRYLEYLRSYDKVLEKKFPTAVRVYRVFTVGVKDFTRDVKDYFRIVRILNASQKNKFQSLTRREIELYHQMPKDMRKAAPVLIISTLPFGYSVIPMAYLFPRILLTSHFWTLQQKFEFNMIYLKTRLVHNRPLFRCVQGALDQLSGHKCYCEWMEVLGMMGSGVQPPLRLILNCKELFMTEPYHLFYLTGTHVKHLLKIHNLHTGWFRRSRLAERAIILKEMDNAILREGGVHNMPTEAIKNACFIRGLNPVNMRIEDMIRWLNHWIIISTEVDRENLSLLLHCPILLAYNEPSNWALIYTKK